MVMLIEGVPGLSRLGNAMLPNRLEGNVGSIENKIDVEEELLHTSLQVPEVFTLSSV